MKLWFIGQIQSKYQTERKTNVQVNIEVRVLKPQNFKDGKNMEQLPDTKKILPKKHNMLTVCQVPHSLTHEHKRHL